MHDFLLLFVDSFKVCPSCTRIINFLQVVILLDTMTGTLRVALHCRHVFSVGVSHYGVADCELLAQDTHKFESRYLDSLIGCVILSHSTPGSTVARMGKAHNQCFHLSACVLLEHLNLTRLISSLPANSGLIRCLVPHGRAS